MKTKWTSATDSSIWITSTYNCLAIKKFSYHIPSVSCGVPDVVCLLGVSIWSISFPPINKTLSISNPLALRTIPLTPSITLFTAIWLLYSSPVSKAVANFPICISAGSTTRRWESLSSFLFIFLNLGVNDCRSFIMVSLKSRYVFSASETNKGFFTNIDSCLVFIHRCFTVEGSTAKVLQLSITPCVIILSIFFLTASSVLSKPSSDIRTLAIALWLLIPKLICSETLSLKFSGYSMFLF